MGNITGEGPTFTLGFTSLLTDSLGNQSHYNSSVAGGQWVVTSSDGAGCSSCTTRGVNTNQFDGKGNLLWNTDAMGHTVLYKYDSSNNLLSQTVQLDSNTNAITSYTYNSFGEALTVTDALEVAGKVLPEHIAKDCHGNNASCPGGP